MYRINAVKNIVIGDTSTKWKFRQHWKNKLLRWQVKVKTWIKIGQPTLISVLIKGESLFSRIPPFITHRSCDQILLSMSAMVESCHSHMGSQMGLVGSRLNPTCLLTWEVLFIYVPLNLHSKGRRQVKVKTWIKRGGCPLISVLIEGGSLLFQIFILLKKIAYLVINFLYQCLVWVWTFVRNIMHYWKLEE